jgi:hypothetical protein
VTLKVQVQCGQLQGDLGTQNTLLLSTVVAQLRAVDLLLSLERGGCPPQPKVGSPSHVPRVKPVLTWLRNYPAAEFGKSACSARVLARFMLPTSGGPAACTVRVRSTCRK